MTVDYGSKYKYYFNCMPDWMMKNGSLLCKQLDIRKEKFTWSQQVAISFVSWYGMDSDLFGNMWEYFLFIKLELAVKNVMT